MSVAAGTRTTGYAPSNRIDGIVLAVWSGICLLGMSLTSPNPSVAPPPSDIGTLKTIEVTIDPDGLPTPDVSSAPNNGAGTDEASPPLPALKPPADIDVPSIKPDLAPEEDGLNVITPRILAELSPSEHIASGPGFISLMGTSYNPTNWHRSTHAATSDFLATDWTENHALYDADGLSLKIEPSPDKPGHFVGGEIQTSQTYGYGRYEVLMRPAKASGTVSSFFTYTGPYHGNPHDEVDIEFLGADTTKIYLNYFSRGRVGEDVTLDLPFDAADALHLYAFEWHRDGITWFVDGQPVHQTRGGDPLIPQTPGAIIVNLWAGQPKLYSWHGRPNFQHAQAEYACISFQPLGSTGRSCSTVFPPQPPSKPRSQSLLSRAVSELVTKLTLSEDGPSQIN
jgi:hypothetical protein